MARMRISVGMERQIFQPRSPGELREMARASDDPVIREALATLADFVEQECVEREQKGPPWSVKH